MDMELRTIIGYVTILAQSWLLWGSYDVVVLLLFINFGK